jgi:hypothetical protein
LKIINNRAMTTEPNDRRLIDLIERIAVPERDREPSRRADAEAASCTT